MGTSRFLQKIYKKHTKTFSLDINQIFLKLNYVKK